MHSSITMMLKRYNCQTSTDYKNALKEIFQEVTLLGLSRQNFFEKAAFYGGTALRIAHGLERFSEDLDFTLDKPNSDFDIKPYLKGIEEEFKALGLKLSAIKKDKSLATGVESAFLKANTLEHLLMIEGVKNTTRSTNLNDVIKIKLEIDINPPLPRGKTETLNLLEPIPFSYRIQALSSLFGGKLHAILCREFIGSRVKGRDFYDFIWYVRRQVKPDLDYLKGKLIESGKLSYDDDLSINVLKVLLRKKFESIDWEMAKSDVAPFIKDGRELEIWSSSFFISLLDKL